MLSHRPDHTAQWGLGAAEMVWMRLMLEKEWLPMSQIYFLSDLFITTFYINSYFDNYNNTGKNAWRYFFILFFLWRHIFTTTGDLYACKLNLSNLAFIFEPYVLLILIVRSVFTSSIIHCRVLIYCIVWLRAIT